LTCATARDWTDSLSKVVRRSAGEAAVGQQVWRGCAEKIVKHIN